MPCNNLTATFEELRIQSRDTNKTHMKRLLFSITLLMALACSRSAEAHGDGLVFLIGMVFLPLHFFLFIPICFLPGIEGRRNRAFWIYVITVVISYWLQVQSWYHPIARWFPDPYFWSIPGTDQILFNVLSLAAIYFALRRNKETLATVTPMPTRNLLAGLMFSMFSVSVWAFGVYAVSSAHWWPSREARMWVGVPWVAILPFGLAFAAVWLFMNGRFLKRK
jgi:hypothetical protein